jgi:hypothetical protein
VKQFLIDFYDHENLDGIDYSLTDVYETIEELVSNNFSSRLHVIIEAFYSELFNDVFSQSLNLTGKNQELLTYLSTKY